MHCRLPLLVAGVIVVVMALAAHAPGTRAEEPLVVSPQVMAEFADYKARRTPMYFAVSSDGLFSWYAYCIDIQCGDAQKYRRITVEHCEQEGGTDCLIFAIGNDVQVEYRVGDPATMVPAKATPCAIETFAGASSAASIVAALRPAQCSDLRRFGYYDDFKAFATSDLTKFKVARGWSSHHGNPADAIKGAMAQCEKSRKALSVSDPCQLFAIGDIVVYGMSEALQSTTVEIYKKNKDATNADLPPPG